MSPIPTPAAVPNNVVTLRPPQPAPSKPPAHDFEAEAAVLAACMLQPSCAPLAVSIASPEDFYSGSHAEIARAIADLVEAGTEPDMVAVAIRLRDTGRMSIVGGAAELNAMVEAVAAVGSRVEHVAGKVRDLAQVRRVGDELRRLLGEAYEPIPDVGAWLGRVDAVVSEATRRRAGQGAVTSLEATKEVWRVLQAPRVSGVTTGFRALDAVTGGLEASALTVLAARTAMGKSALAMQVVAAAAESGKRVLVVSLEMPRVQLMRRLICARSGVPLVAIRSLQITQTQWSAYSLASSEIAAMPIAFADPAVQTFADIRAAVRSQAPELLVVDHIGLVRPAGGSGQRSREQEVAAVSRGLKGIALESSIPVLALCQVGRDAAKGARRPVLSDLRESGSIEQDADNVWMIHRPGYYDAKAPPEIHRQAELVVAKQRDGATAILDLEWQALTATFTEPFGGTR